MNQKKSFLCAIILFSLIAVCYFAIVIYGNDAMYRILSSVINGVAIWYFCVAFYVWLNKEEPK